MKLQWPCTQPNVCDLRAQSDILHWIFTKVNVLLRAKVMGSGWKRTKKPQSFRLFLAKVMERCFFHGQMGQDTLAGRWDVMGRYVSSRHLNLAFKLTTDLFL